MAAARWWPAPRRVALYRSVLAALALALASPDALARRCGDEGVWLQILGSGGPALDDSLAVASYLVWVDDRARLLVDAGSGTALRFGEAGAAFADLDAIVFTTLSARATVDFPAFLEGSARTGRTRPLPVFAPADPAESGDAAQTFFERMGALYGQSPRRGAVAADTRKTYALRIRGVPAAGSRRWASFRSERIALAAVPVHHGGTPAVAWRVDAGGVSLVFAGGFSNQRDVVGAFAKDVDALVVHHAIPEHARGEVLQRYATPSKLGRVAAKANARMLILGHRTDRVRGRETASSAAIEAQFDGPVLFANDLECWGM